MAGSAAGRSSVSKTEGSSGGSPSIAHLFVSYFERMNDSILLLIENFRKKKVKRNVQHQLTDLAGHVQTSSVLPNTC